MNLAAKNLFLIILFFQLTFSALSNPDSLMTLYTKAGHDSVKIKILIKAGDYYKQANADSAVTYYNMAAKLSIRHLEDDNFYKFYTAKALRNSGTALLISGRNSDAIDYLYKANRFFKYVENDKKYKNEALSGMSACYNNLGLIYFDNGMFDKSVEHFIISIRYDEGLGDTLGAAITYGNIGMVHYTMGNFEKSIEYYQKQVATSARFNDSISAANALNNIGVSYKAMQRYDEALKYYRNTLGIRKSIGDKSGISATYNNLGEVYLYIKKFRDAETYFKQALTLKKELGDINGVILTLNNLAWLSIETGKPKIAMEYAKEAELLCMKSEYLQELINSYKYLTQAYLLMKDFESAVRYSQLQLNATDSLFQMQKTRIMAEMESRFHSEKKQQEIEKQQLQLKKNEEEIMRRKAEAKNQRNISIALTLVLLLVVLLAFFIYRNYREKKRANVIISEKNKQLEYANSEISSQRDEIQAQRDVVSDQKEKIEHIHKEQTDSIRYARNIQRAVFPAFESLDKIFSEYFVFFRPRNIVSGDFYWATTMDNYIVACVADCTGHGVPGAFMSMLGISALNEIVLKKKITEPSLILEELRNTLVSALKQESDSEDMADVSKVKDGMDASLCVFDNVSRKLSYAGAYNSCWFLPGVDCGFEEPIIELKGDKMPVGIHIKMQDFTEKKILVKGSGQVIMFTDGFSDQFGGEKNEKFKSKRLKELLYDLKDLKMVEQQIVLHEYFEEWKGINVQTDDVTILSFRV